MSSEYKKYIKKRNNERLIIKLIQLSLFILTIFLWETLTRTNIINSFIVSSPTKIIKTTIELFKHNSLLKHISITLLELLISVILNMLISISLATILWWNNKIYKVLEPYLNIINSTPKVALSPIILIWFGTSIKSIILIAILISFITITLNIYNEFININKYQEKMIRTFSNKKKTLFKYLIFPKSIKTIISNIKICLSLSLIGVITGEFLVSKYGIGYLIIYGTQIFNLNLVITGIIILLLISYILYEIIKCIENKKKR